MLRRPGLGDTKLIICPSPPYGKVAAILLLFALHAASGIIFPAKPNNAPTITMSYSESFLPIFLASSKVCLSRGLWLPRLQAGVWTGHHGTITMTTTTTWWDYIRDFPRTAISATVPFGEPTVAFYQSQNCCFVPFSILRLMLIWQSKT